MKLSEAYSVLELQQTASLDDAKKQYKLLAKKWHPDLNKAAGAEEQFKRINQAYDLISGKTTDREEMQHNPFSGFNPFGNSNPFGRQVSHQATNINIETEISFKDSVIGCKKDLKISRKTKCNECSGQGQFTIHNGCDKCGGKGQIINKNGNMVFVQTCDKCHGKAKVSSCKPCSQSGVIDAEITVNVAIPGGVVNSNILRLSGMGHYVGSFGPMDQHTDVHLKINVIPEPNLTIDGKDVICNITISLLEALQGCKKIVNTILGDKEIDIFPKSRNKDFVLLPKLGVNQVGDQKVILDVKYPDDVNSIIEQLKGLN